MTALSIVPLAVAAGLLLLAVKRALIGERSVLQSIVCFADGSRHVPVREPMGHRCKYCGATCADLSEWGYDGYVSPMSRVYSREEDSVERSERW